MGCAQPPFGFGVPAEEVRDRFDVVALASIRLPSSFARRNEIASRLEAGLEERLVEAGLGVVPTSEFERLWRALADDVGGIHDPRTGMADDEKFEIVSDAAYRELRASRNVDAVAYLSVDLEYVYGVWEFVFACGGRTEIYWPGGWYGPRATMVTVACLELDVYDASRRHLYGVRSMVQVIETHGHQTRATRPDEEIFADVEGVSRSLDLVVSPFTKIVGRGD